MGYFKLYATDQISLAVPKKAYFMNSIMIGSFVDQSGLVFFFRFFVFEIRFRFRFSDFRRRGAFPRWNPNEDALTYAHNEINLIRQRL